MAKMTREEIIEILSMLKSCWAMLDGTPDEREAAGWVVKALDAAISALRGPAREQVGRMKGEWIDKPTGRYGQWQTWCIVCGKHSGIGGIKSNRHRPFCPNCGAPMTDEAVDMVMERLEEMQNDQ